MQVTAKKDLQLGNVPYKKGDKIPVEKLHEYTVKHLESTGAISVARAETGAQPQPADVNTDTGGKEK